MYKVIVVGGGHAGIEAALSSARRGFKTLLITSNISYIGAMPCNPSIGGPAKGIVVREIDCLGGQMGRAADANTLQVKMLNLGKGPGVHALRAQIDRLTYPKYMQTVLSNTENLQLIEDMVEDIIVENNKVKGVRGKSNSYYSETVIITTGTFLSPYILKGKSITSSGPDNQNPSLNLSSSIVKLGHNVRRLKTGTPPRINKNSIDTSKMDIEYGHEGQYSFSYQTEKEWTLEEQEICYMIKTTAETKNIITDNLKLSAMYSGEIRGVGPRYCPSIEDKIVRFADKDTHLLFIEPESMLLDTLYLQGFSTSMPEDIQDKMVRSLPGLENCEIVKYAYAIEYDAIDPLTLKPSLESKFIQNLFFAGQINGTSGYEEAAGQGLIAGINATKKLENEPPFILKRSEGYIGVMIDDLVTKGVLDPYRLLTSRAEHRLLLRHDNADERLLHYGYGLKLIPQEQYNLFLQKQETIEKVVMLLFKTNLSPDIVNPLLLEKGYEPSISSVNLGNLLKRPNILFEDIIKFIDIEPLSKELQNSIQIKVKYEGYIKEQEKQVKRLNELEDIIIPSNIDYLKVPHLSLESRAKLTSILPINLGQASRISGITPADIGVLARYIKQNKN